MKESTRFWLACQCLIGLLLLSISAELQAEDSTATSIPIGLLVPPEETDAASLRQGAGLGIEQANELPGPPVRLVVRGRAGQWGTEGDEAAALALDEAVAAIIAPPAGSASHQILQVAGRTRLPVVSLCPDSSVTGTGLPWMVRVAPRSDEEARIIFAGLSDGPLGKFSRWSALVPAERPGRETARDLLAAAKAVGCLLDEPIRVPLEPAEWTPIIERVLAFQPQAVLLWNDPVTAGRLARALRKAGFKGLMSGPGRLRSEAFLRESGNAAEGLVIPAIVSAAESEPEARRFVEAYRGRFGCEPDTDATLAYDAALLLAGVLRKSAAQTAYQAFPLKTTFPGASGFLKFDRDGNRVVTLSLQVWRDGQLKTLTATGRRSGSDSASASANQ